MRAPENANVEVDEDGFSPIWWYEVYGPDGKVWCATGNADEARRSMRPDDKVYCVWEKREYKRKPLDGN